MHDSIHLDIPKQYLTPASKEEQGVFSFIVRSAEIDELIAERYGRDRCCLKVFKRSADVPLDEFLWHQNPLVDCTRIQNIFARHELAPRVFDIVKVDGRYVQVTEDATRNEYRGDANLTPSILSRHLIRTRWDMNPKNWVNGALVDFQSFRWTRHDLYEQFLIDLAYEHAAWGSRKEPYQSLLGTPSQRDTNHRCSVMRLDEVDFVGKSVLDIGCNLGTLCIRSSVNGAFPVTGIDLFDVADIAYFIANWLGYWNINYLGLTLPGDFPDITADVVFALSVDRQIGYAPWMAEACNELFYLEGHVADKESTFRERLEADFSRVECLGSTKDHGPRPVFRCWK